MGQARRRRHQTQRADRLRAPGDVGDDLDQEVHMALRVHAARDGEAHELHARGHEGPVLPTAEHQRADLHGADARGQVQFAGQGLGRIAGGRDVRQQARGVEVNRVPARRLDDRHSRRSQAVAQILDRADPVLEVVLVEHLAQADRHRLEVAPGQAAVGREALAEDQGLTRLVHPLLVVERQEAADVDERVLLGAHPASIRV